MTPVEKFSTTTSALAIISRTTCRPSGDLRSMATLRLLRLVQRKGAPCLRSGCSGGMQRPIGAKIIAPARRLDLDDFRAHVGQDHRGQRPGDEMREIDDPDALQGLWCMGGTRRMFGKFRFKLIQHFDILVSCSSMARPASSRPLQAAETLR